MFSLKHFVFLCAASGLFESAFMFWFSPFLSLLLFVHLRHESLGVCKKVFDVFVISYVSYGQ